MRNLIICCDGTWNSRRPDPQLGGEPTNVVRLHAALARSSADGTAQLRYYHTGVGTEGSLMQRAWEGLTGAGLDRNIMSAYKWLGVNYRVGDRIYLFGFSRGAYTIRSLGGMLSKCGLLNLDGLASGELWRRIESAYHEGYRGGRNWTQWSSGWKFHGPTAGKHRIPIHFVGVWDTVGSLGIPAELGIFSLLHAASRKQFHDTTLGKDIAHARHAISIDEGRSTFVPTLWTDVDPDRDVKQLWFPGVHADVGGGYPQRGLADTALNWMLREARDCGLGIRDSAWGQLNPDPRGQVHDSYQGLFRALKYRPRAMPMLTDTSRMHESALERHLNPPPSGSPYRPTRALEVGEQVTLPIHARQRWNETGVYLERGARYRFDASGEWRDARIACGPAGTRDGNFHPAEVLHWVGSLAGLSERAYRRVSGNQVVDAPWSRRVEALPWFSLVGVLANGTGPASLSSQRYHTTVGIGAHREYPERSDQRVTRPGYLWCFANDAWRRYENNRGSVELTITRLA